MLIVVGVIVALGVLLIALALQKRWKRAQSAARSLLISYTFVVLVLGGAEYYLRYIYADSRMEFALPAQNWEQRYVQRNTLGFRDRDWDRDELAQRTTIFAIGDSFTEGWGINHPADRWTDVLAAHLGDDYAVVNMGMSGSATSQQLEAMQGHPYTQPDVILYQYFLNDIDIAAKSNGMGWAYEVPPAPPLVNESYLVSFLYWRLNYDRLFVNTVDGRSEWEFMYAAYDNAYIWDIHRAEIERVIDFAEERGARLVVVIFPNMRDPVGSIPYTDRVAQVFEARRHTDILKLFDAAAQWTPEARMVSAYDSHASVAFNRLVGDLVYERFFGGAGAE